MPPKSSAGSAPKSKSSAPPSRRSTRVAGGGVGSNETENAESKSGLPKSSSTKKRAPEDDGEPPKSKPKSKKAKGESSSAEKPKASSAAVAVEEEKKHEAPASAKPDTGGKGVLKVGDQLPKITLHDQDGNEVEVGSLAGEKGVVLFLYPKADTPGCTTQACGFRDAHDEITKLGYEIYGLSKDKSPAQLKWATKKELKYKLLSDPESKLIKRLGAFVQPNNTKRSHFIFEKGTGKLVDASIGVKPKDDPENVLNFIKNLK